MGGYVSGPIGLAAVLSRTKLVIHEQNAIPGFTNKILFSSLKKCLKGFRHFQARTPSIPEALFEKKFGW